MSKRSAIAMTFGLLGLVLGVFLPLAESSAIAQGSERYVATTGFDNGTCTDPGEPCRTIQHAVDVATGGDVIKVAAGIYTDIHDRPAPTLYQGPSNLAQVVYISKTVTIRGGYEAANGFAGPPDPEANPTTLDAQGQGRVIFVTGDISPTIEGLHIKGGDAFWLGGGLWDEDTGGGVYIDHASATLSNNTLCGNVAHSGGGVYLRGSDATLRNNLVIGNQSIGTDPGTPAGGGGIYLLSSAATLEGNLLTANDALRRGGGVWLFSSHNATLRNNDLFDNTANRGGALFLDASNASLSGNTVISNSATYGGGLYLEGSDANLDRNTIQANTANVGGGLFVYRCNPTLINTVIASNPGGVGSGLYIEGSMPRLLHTTLAGGRAAGTGIWLDTARGFDSDYPSTAWLTNTILVSYTVGITAAGGNTVTLAATLWGTATWANQVDWGGAGTISAGTVNIWDDPAFVNPGGGDYHLGLGSAATDAGLDAGVGHDLDGESRPIGPDPDLGADEASVLVGKAAAPLRVQPGALLTYTLRVTNVSNIDLQATITDALPSNVTTTQPLVWTPLITAPGGIWAQTLVVTVEQDYLGPLVNEMCVTSDEGAEGAAQVTALAVLRVYLPLVLR